MSQAFITGSYAYGEPKTDSDVDLVIFTSGADAEKLTLLLGDEESVSDLYEGSHSISLKVGKLNLIVCTTKDAHLAWAGATISLRQKAPVSRVEAVQTVKRFLRSLGCE